MSHHTMHFSVPQLIKNVETWPKKERLNNSMQNWEQDLGLFFYDTIMFWWLA